MKNGIAILPLEKVKHKEFEFRPLLQIVKEPIAKRPQCPTKPAEGLCQRVEKGLEDWEKCFFKQAAKKLKKAIAAERTDDRSMKTGKKGHRRR